MIFLRLLTWPYVRKHKLRSLLTLLGIVIGVAVFVGMHTANQTVGSAFQQTVDKIAGKAQLQITAGDTGFPEDVLDKVQGVREVRAAAPVVEAVLNTGLAGQGSLLVLGVDMTGDSSLREYDLEGKDEEVIDDPLVFLAQPDSIILSRNFAEKNGIARNQKLTLSTMEGPRQFTVRGIMKAEGLATAFGGNLAIMDIYAAQKVFGRGRMFDRIDIGVADGAEVAAVRRKLEEALGSGFDVQPPASRGQHFDAVARGLSMTINMTSLFALLIGVFIIYNAFSIAITQRRSEIGILRAMGATQAQIQWMFVIESAVAGLFGSVLGVMAGLGIARGVAPQLSYIVQEVYGMTQKAGQISGSPGLIAGALAIGVMASVAGGFLPARAAARVDPVKALQKGRYQVLSEGENRWRMILAAALGAVALAALLFGTSNAVFYLGYLFCIVALVLLTPAMALWLAKAIRPLMKWIAPVEGTLAADSLIQAPRRTSATVSALMLSLALAVGFAGMSAAIYRSVIQWMDNTLNPDLFVSTSESITARSFRFPIAMRGQIAAVPGVEEVRPVRSARVNVKGKPAMLIAVELEHIEQRVKYISVEGDRVEMIRLGKQGQGVIVSESLANIRGLHKGEIVELSTPSGTLKLPVVGVIIDFSDQQGSVILDRAVYLRYWKDDTADVFRVYLKKGSDVQAVREEMLKRLTGQRKLFVMTNASLRKFILDVTGQWFGMTYVQLGVALLVAILGIVNTLTVSITDRRRELGVLQAVGGLRSQIRRTIWLEAMAIGLIGAILGCGMGAVTLYYTLGMTRRDMAGMTLDYIYPFGFASALLPVMLGVALLAALWPAEAAVRTSLVEALEYE